MPFTRLAESVTILYADLLDQLRAADLPHPARGSFVSKTIGGSRYWYLQTVRGGRKHQQYLGPETPDLLQHIDSTREAKGAATADETARRRIVSMLRAGGAAAESAPFTAVLEALAGAAVFRNGGVLVGTQAFACYANMLGVRFEAQSLRTADVDIAQQSVAVAAPPVDVLAKLRESEPRFFAVPELDPRHPHTSFKVRGRDLRVDFLTPARSARATAPVFLRHLGVAAQPLRGIGYLLEDVVDAAVLGGAGVLVRVPAPARFAVHKLWLASHRPASDQVKARKDLRQAAQLLEVLQADRPEDVDAAFDAVEKHRALLPGIRSSMKKMRTR